MKQCRYCQKRYPESDFGIALTTENKIYYRLKCRSCYRATKKLLALKTKAWLTSYKQRQKCARCSNSDYRVLEFHHLNSKQKEFGISVAFYNHYGLERIRKEVAKCVILCANCHRITHVEARKRSNGA